MQHNQTFLVRRFRIQELHSDLSSSVPFPFSLGRSHRRSFPWGDRGEGKGGKKWKGKEGRKVERDRGRGDGRAGKEEGGRR